MEGEGFKNLMKCLEPVPSSTHISELVKKKYVAAKERLKDKLKQVGSLGITTISGQVVLTSPTSQLSVILLMVIGR